MIYRCILFSAVFFVLGCESDIKEQENEVFELDTTRVNGRVKSIHVLRKGHGYPILIKDDKGGVSFKATWMVLNDTVYGDLVYFNPEGDTNYTTQYKGQIDHGVQRIFNKNKVITIDSIDNGDIVFSRSFTKNGEIDSTSFRILFIPHLPSHGKKDTITISNKTTGCDFVIKQGNPLHDNLRVEIKIDEKTYFNEFNNNHNNVELNFSELPYGVINVEITNTQSDHDLDFKEKKKSVKYWSCYSFTFNNLCVDSSTLHSHNKVPHASKDVIKK